MYKSQDLSVLAYANGYTLWHYKTNDCASEVLTFGYFNKAFDMLRKNDRIQTTVRHDHDDADSFDLTVVRNDSQKVEVKMIKAIAVLG